jgi:acetolactate synthase-1/2/3 large subunit
MVLVTVIVFVTSRSPRFGPASRGSLATAAKIINKCTTGPCSCWVLLASMPENADAFRAFLRQTGLPVVGTFQAAGIVSADLFKRFAGRIGQLDNTPGDELLVTADVIITVGYDPVEYDPSIWNHPLSARIIHLAKIDAWLSDMTLALHRHAALYHQYRDE